MAKEYNEDSIKVLKGLDAVRTRPDMYLGSTTGKSSPALYRMFREILDNSLDEYLIGVNKLIHIFIGNEIVVVDNGRGVPSGISKETGKTVLETVFGELHSSGKFDHEAYSMSSGKNGVGSSCTNALSSKFRAFSNNNKKKKWTGVEFAAGKFVKNLDETEYSKYVEKTGTVVEYVPDSCVFKDGVKFDLSRLKHELSDLKYLCPGLHMHLHTADGDFEYFSEDGLVNLVKEEQNNLFTYSDNDMDVALNFSNIDGSSFKSFVNLCNTDMGGTHLNGLKQAITDTVKTYSNVKLNNADILEGVLGVIHYKMAEPQYQSQTKNELCSAVAKTTVVDTLVPKLKSWFKANEKVRDRIVKYAEKMFADREKMKAQKDLYKNMKDLTASIYKISDKFLDAERRKHDVKDLELFIVEGDSAGGHFKNARRSNQAELKIRGKIINAARASFAELFGNAKDKTSGNREIKDLVTALGTGILDNYDESKIRFGKVVIETDADSDGNHISNLIIAFFATYMPDLIKNGHLYTIDAPLFIANSRNLKVGGMTRAEVDKKMKDAKVKDYVVTRLKGWGECSPEQLAEICLNPETRKLIRIEWDEKCEEMVEKTMGDDTSFRKSLLNI